MLKGQVLKPWAHSSGVRVESGRGERESTVSEAHLLALCYWLDVEV